MILFSTHNTSNGADLCDSAVCKNFTYDEKTDAYSAAPGQELKEHKKNGK